MQLLICWLSRGIHHAALLTLDIAEGSLQGTRLSIAAIDGSSKEARSARPGHTIFICSYPFFVAQDISTLCFRRFQVKAA